MRNKQVGLLAVAVAAIGLALVIGQGMMGAPGSGYGYGYGGMMGAPGSYGGMMGGPGMGMGMMGGPGMSGMMGVYPPGARPIPEEEARRRLSDFAARVAPGARVKDVMAFSQNYYAQIVDASGRGLAEVLVDRYSGVVFPEPGPNMMWRGASGYLGARPRYDLEAAKGLALEFLEGYLPKSRIFEEQAFDGYYTFDFGRDSIEGMLSVNAYSGEVWVHTWHGVYLGAGEETH